MSANHDFDHTTIANALSTLGNKYAIEQTTSDSSGTAFKITKQESNLALYLIVCHDPDCVEFITFDGDEVVNQTSLYSDSKATGKYADIIRNCFQGE